MNLKKIKTNTVTVFEINTGLDRKDFEKAIAFDRKVPFLLDKETQKVVFAMGVAPRQSLSEDLKLINFANSNRTMIYSETYENLAKDEEDLITAQLAGIAKKVEQVVKNAKAVLKAYDKLIKEVEVVDTSAPDTVEVEEDA